MTAGPALAGIDQLRRGLVVWTPGPRPGSMPEIQHARLIVDAGYPVPERQVEIFDADGMSVGRVDLALRAERVALEYLAGGGRNRPCQPVVGCSVRSRSRRCWNHFSLGQPRGPRRVGVPARLTRRPGSAMSRVRMVRATVSSSTGPTSPMVAVHRMRLLASTA